MITYNRVYIITIIRSHQGVGVPALPGFEVEIAIIVIIFLIIIIIIVTLHVIILQVAIF